MQRDREPERRETEDEQLTDSDLDRVHGGMVAGDLDPMAAASRESSFDNPIIADPRSPVGRPRGDGG